ncbi:threonine-phosphate decarboxylase CobD [Thiocapsa marina]|uniref:threonine-phosphate decarboxylase n=1 Tax=Thiocapsa marina 5811 TaxID=768671 RepID=F9UFE1_9GAMM|nr:threonine-phosphate decarboxylase CobD [Thiocapsa marina]EGV17178.1 L-threonine-O-3-phosphate decarboxylase [Thiocapsa marina 5811]
MTAHRLPTAGPLALNPPPLEHGGRLREAAARYRIPFQDWLDLSTGINPDGWPVPEVPGAAWARLPEEDDGLEETAARCYGVPALLPVAGSQAAIQTLPELRVPGRVGVPAVGYQEHAQAWQRAGHTLAPLADGVPGGDRGAGLDDLDVLVVINPNNPTGRRWPVSTLLDWHARLAARGGWLLVDEAFMDTTPRHSLAPYTDRQGLIVLRSLGKFYGLAGVRVGFVLGTADLREALRSRLGPWALSGPARHVARLALSDSPWQEATRASLRRASVRLAALLSDYGLVPTGGTDLFQWICTAEAPAIQDRLARQGIWVRRFDAPASLRFGLPGAEAGWARLESGLRCLASDVPGDGPGDVLRQTAGATAGIRPFSSVAPPLAPAPVPVPGDPR